MGEISENTKKIVHRLYKSREAFKVCDILKTECGTEALSCEGWSPEQMDRIHFAVLKLSKEKVIDFDSAVELAQRDWRDLLTLAGFGHDLEAHERWASENAY